MADGEEDLLQYAGEEEDGAGETEELDAGAESAAAATATTAEAAPAAKSGASAGADAVDPDIANLESTISEMDEEAQKLKSLQEKQKELISSPAATTPAAPGNPAEVDARSIHIGNVDFAAKAEELVQLFSPCGSVVRATILLDKMTGRPKGYAYLEFADSASVELAVTTLDGSMLHNRPLKVMRKRTNLPAFMLGRGGRGGGFFPRGGFAPRGPPRGFFGGFRGATRRGFRGGARNRAYYSPYPTG